MTDLQKIRSIFCEALEKETQEEREAYLTQICRDDSRLRAEVDSLLRTQAEADKFFKGPLISMEIPQGRLSEAPGTVINRYKLLEKIGEGGMAVVYMAEQEQPIRRKVALKIIKLGMDTKSVIARFEAERQALAMMDHPNIAKVLDAGATETGRPYFVMELVKGVSITDYCDANSLSTKERLELFIQVCNAVQHAHQKGIIHRDIKPTNVMVTLHDGKPVPKVIDFGIAKAINQKLTEKTLFTRYAHIIGTPAYMSPEQAELSDLDIDTRTDIYSLGVLLYELLTGTPPFGEEELRKAGYIEMQRVIREQEPVKPSTRIRTSTSVRQWHRHPADDSWAGSPCHKHPASPLTHCSTYEQVRGDLDWIVMKSLEKDRARRYETANGLALDVQRHLEHEPVIARGPGTTYRVQKFLRRHRSQTVAALAVMVVAAAGAIILSMWNEDRLQLDAAQEFSHRGILSQAREQYAKADRDAALETIKPILDSRHVGPEAQLLYAGILVDNRRSGEAVKVLEPLVDERPEIAGTAHSLLARILYESESPDAEKLKQIDEHRQKAEALLFGVPPSGGKDQSDPRKRGTPSAEAYFLRAMFAVTIKDQFAALNEALQLDPSHYESRRLRAFTYYASRKYDRLRDDALVMTVIRPRGPLGYSLRAIALRELGKYAEAITEYDNAIGLLTKGDPQYIDLSTQRCETLLRMGDYERVITDAQGYLKLSPENPVLQYHVFSALTALGEYERAAALFRRIISPGHEARVHFQDWCAKYVFDTLEAGRSWHPPGPAPTGAVVSWASRPRSEGGTPSTQRGQDGRDTVGAAFLPMVEAEETYRALAAKARRLTTDGFSARWSPDGKKLAFSAGVHGYSGVAVFDPATKETELLIVPGKDPVWSPDGNYIAFVRDCQLLRISEFIAAEREDQHRLMADEEVWVMKSDGTEPRRLSRGGWPSWSQDSTCIYYQSRVDNVLCSISIEGQNAKPNRIMACSNVFPSVSPDNQRVAYLNAGKLKIIDLTSQESVAECAVPSMTWGVSAWSPTGNEVCLGGSNPEREKTGLWIYSFNKPQAAEVLSGQIALASWSEDGTKLVFALGPPYFEIWAADLDPNIPTIEALGPGQPLDEHLQEMLALYTRRIEADPQDAYAYSSRAHYYDYLHERQKAQADMRRWSAILSGSDLPLATPRNTRRVINGPFEYQLVFSAERPVNETPILNVAFGQKPSGSFVQPGCDSSTKTAKKGRCNMKPFQMPILSMSLLGLCLLSGLDTTSAYADFTFGEPVNVKSVIPFIDAVHDSIECFGPDGLEMYISSNNRPGGSGDVDLCVLKRASEGDHWGNPENLGPVVNTDKEDSCSCISDDGLTLYFASDRSGGYGGYDIYTTMRADKNSPWGAPVNLGPNVNSSANEAFPLISPGSLELHFPSTRAGGYGTCDIYVARRATRSDPWGAAVNLGPVVNSAYSEDVPGLSPDGLVLLFSGHPILDSAAHRPGGYGGADIWMSRRATLQDPWQTPVNLGPKVNGPGKDCWARISLDGSLLYFLKKSQAGIWDYWQAPILSIVDFNGDGKLDVADVFIMLEHWYTDYSLCDIGPMPWGDGIVDAQDLIVLAEHMANKPVAVNDVNAP